MALEYFKRKSTAKCEDEILGGTFGQVVQVLLGLFLACWSILTLSLTSVTATFKSVKCDGTVNCFPVTEAGSVSHILIASFVNSSMPLNSQVQCEFASSFTSTLGFMELPLTSLVFLPAALSISLLPTFLPRILSRMLCRCYFAEFGLLVVVDPIKTAKDDRIVLGCLFAIQLSLSLFMLVSIWSQSFGGRCMGIAYLVTYEINSTDHIWSIVGSLIWQIILLFWSFVCLINLDSEASFDPYAFLSISRSINTVAQRAPIFCQSPYRYLTHSQAESVLQSLCQKSNAAICDKLISSKWNKFQLGAALLLLILTCGAIAGSGLSVLQYQ